MASFFSYTEVCKNVCETCPGDKVGYLGVVDYILLAAVLMVSAGIGIYYIVLEYRMTRKATSEDILMGGRDMGVFPIAMSLMASFMSAITVLGTPTEMYNVNAAYWLAGLAMIPTTIITNHIFLPFFHELSFTSAYEYLEVRFNFAVRAAASVIFVLNMVLYMGVVLYAPSLALNAVTSLPLWACIMTIGIVCTFYTALGGLKAVVWSDTFQTFIVMAGLIAVIIRGVQEVGGIEEVWRLADDGGRIFFFDWSVDPTVRHSVWSLVIGSMVGSLTIYAANQTMIHRYLSIKDSYNSKKALYVSLPLTITLSTLVCIVGLVIYASYSKCDPYMLDIVVARDQLLPLLVMDKLTVAPGLAGLFVACLFSASLSSISSGLNALAIVILEDLIKPFWKWRHIDVKPATTGTVAKSIGLIFGGVIIGLAFLFSKMGQTVLQIMLSIFGMVGGPLLGLFICGIFFPYIEAQGAFWGFLVSSTFSFWMGLGATIVLPTPPISGVSTESCRNQDILMTDKCTFNNFTSPANYSTRFMMTSPNATTISMTSTTQSSPPDYNGTDLWIYHVSYLWYALAAVVMHVITSHVISIVCSCWKGANGPDDVEGNLVHAVVDRVCCYWTLACRRVVRGDEDDPAVGDDDDHEMSVYSPSKANEPDASVVAHHHGNNGGQSNKAYVADEANGQRPPSYQDYYANAKGQGRKGRDDTINSNSVDDSTRF